MTATKAPPVPTQEQFEELRRRLRAMDIPIPSTTTAATFFQDLVAVLSQLDGMAKDEGEKLLDQMRADGIGQFSVDGDQPGDGEIAKRFVDQQLANSKYLQSLARMRK